VDNGKFDNLTRAIGQGASRRSVLKGLLGLGGASVVGGALVHSPRTEAARRPKTPVPPPKCPGMQYWDGTACVCPDGNTQCGPACCADGVSECCDNACCPGTCYGEELCCARVGDVLPLVCSYRSGTECCGIDATNCCTTDGCCDGACYGGMDGAEFCCGDGGSLCNADECCLNGNACCSIDGCCDGDCYGGDDGASFCCTGLVCDTPAGPVCYPDGECCTDNQCPTDLDTCRFGVCNQGVCEIETCGTGETCCSGSCCPEGRCCENEGGFSVCLSSAGEGACCSVADCVPVELPACWEQVCAYDSGTGEAWCESVDTCAANEICCDNACVVGTECPECSIDADCDPATCLDGDTALQPTCINGQCAYTQVSCAVIDPCATGSCQGGQCITTPPATCNPSPGVVCCPPGWSCPLANPIDCVCQNQYICPDGSCAMCCSVMDCVSNGLGDAQCSECSGGGCVAINQNQPCDLGLGFMGECINGFCTSLS
jgi:hypothetical protein